MLPDDSQAWVPADDEPPDDENTVYSDDDEPEVQPAAQAAQPSSAGSRATAMDIAQGKVDPEVILRDLDWMVSDCMGQMFGNSQPAVCREDPEQVALYQRSTSAQCFG